MHHPFTPATVAHVARGAADENRPDEVAAVVVELAGEPGDLCDAIARVSGIVYGSRIVYPHRLDVIASGPAPAPDPGTRYAWALIVRRDSLTELAERVKQAGAVAGVIGTVSELADMTPCASCEMPTDALALFPGGRCLACYAASPEGRRIPTADELARMWGA